MAIWRLGAEGAREMSIPMFALIGFALGYAAAFGTLSGASLVTALIVGLLIRETVGRGDQHRDEEAAPVAEMVPAVAGAAGAKHTDGAASPSLPPSTNGDRTFDATPKANTPQTQRDVPTNGASRRDRQE